MTNYHYIAAPKGEIYGLDHTLKRFEANTVATLRPDVPEIPKLFLSGTVHFPDPNSAAPPPAGEGAGW